MVIANDDLNTICNWANQWRLKFNAYKVKKIISQMTLKYIYMESLAIFQNKLNLIYKYMYPNMLYYYSVRERDIHPYQNSNGL